MSHDADYDFNLDSPQEDLYNIDLNYDLLPGPRSYESTLSPEFRLDDGAPLSVLSDLEDFDAHEASAEPYPTVTLSSSPERATPIIDLTDSPPLARHRQMGNASSVFEDVDQHNPPESRSVITGPASEMAPRRSTRRRSSTTSAGRARRPPTSRYSTVSLEEDAGEIAGSSRRKRRRVDRPQENESSSQEQPALSQLTQEEVKAEEVDLTEVNDSTTLENALSKQRVDAVKDALQKSQAQDEEGRTVLTSYKCPICMDVLEDATSTVCGRAHIFLIDFGYGTDRGSAGHLFCHRCIMDTLKFSEAQRSQDTGGKAKGTCPVCRKPMARNDKADVKNRTLVPLTLKLQVVPRNRDKGKGKKID